MSNSSNTLLALITGCAIGAVYGILYAPDKGVNTRKKLAEQAAVAGEELADTAMKVQKQVSSRLAEEKQTLDAKVNSLVSDVSYKTEDVITSLENKLAELKAKNKKLQKTS